MSNKHKAAWLDSGENSSEEDSVEEEDLDEDFVEVLARLDALDAKLEDLKKMLSGNMSLQQSTDRSPS